MNMVAAATVVSLSIARVGTQPSQRGPADYFTGSVRIDPLFQAKESTRASGAYVKGSAETPRKIPSHHRRCTRATTPTSSALVVLIMQIGRASCRERV